MNYFQQKKMFLMGQQKKPLIPKEYQQVEYIESTGTQWIDTGIFGKDMINSSIFINMKINYNSTQHIAYFGSYQLDDKCIQIGLMNTSKDICKSTTRIGFSKSINVGDLDLNTFHTIYSENGKQKVDGEIIGYNQQNEKMYDNPDSLLLFARYDDGKVTNISYSRIKEFYITSNNSKIINLIPCCRKSTNKIGLYDTVTNQFFTNQGTGTFLKGADVK